MANALLAAHGPQSIAAAFVKLYRAQLPAPEEMSEIPRHETRAREQHSKGSHPKPVSADRTREKPRPPRGGMSDGVWFKITVGRERNADPKWLLPEICRQGEVAKKDIGAIRVYDTETRFEVAANVAEKFAALVEARKKGGVRIFPAPDGLPADSGAPAQATKRESLPERSPGKHKPKHKPKHKHNKADRRG